jgi:hypothetical protein
MRRGVGTAHAIARAYGVFAPGGRERSCGRKRATCLRRRSATQIRRGIGYACVTNRMGTADPRNVALRAALAWLKA